MHKVMIAKPGLSPELLKAEIDYNFINTTVGGFIEGIYDLGKYGIMMWGNEEAKLKHMEPNLYIYGRQDIACGTILFTSEKMDKNGETVYSNLTKKQQEHILYYCNMNQISKETKETLRKRLKELY